MPTNSSISGDQFIAKVLRPEDAVPSVDGQPLQSTLYRHDTLMVSSRDWSGDFDTFVEITLKRIGLDVHVVAPREIPPPEKSPLAPWASEDSGAPVVLRLRPSTEEAPVGPVDAWRALQFVRFHAAQSRPEFHEPARRMSLEHILRAATTPVPYWGLPGWEGHGDDGQDGPGRMPVKVVASAPPYRTPDVTFGDNRPVVAILDTEVACHDWLPMAGQAEWVVEQIPPVGQPEFDLLNPLVGRVDSHFGHGTFIAGIIRQVAPEARVLSIPVMHSDGCVLESELTTKLTDLLGWVQSGQRRVDVVLLALGYYPETPTQASTSPLRQVLIDLNTANVKIVAAAGNDATTRECYPAAYFKELKFVNAIGATNPNESKAMFSNDNPSTGDPWVTEFRPGVALVSTFPTQVDGSRSAALAKESLGRESFDGDAFDSGFALWQGTSFAAAVHAAGLVA